MQNNTITFTDDSNTKKATVTLEIERFANSLEIEMSNTSGDNCHITLNFEEGKKLAEFIGSWVGYLSA